MNRRYRSKKPKLFSRNLTVILRNSRSRELFLETALKIIGDNEVIVNASLERIDMVIRGEREQINDIYGRLRVLERRFMRSFEADAHNNYFYEDVTINELFMPPIQQRYFTRALSALGFEAELTPDGIRSNADFDQMQQVHDQAVDNLDMIPLDENRAMQHFYATMLLVSPMPIDQMRQLALDAGIIHLVEDDFQFRISIDDAYRQMLDLLQEAKIKPVMQPVDDDFDFSFNEGFGKIVFMKDGKEVDPDENPFDTDDNIGDED